MQCVDLTGYQKHYLQYQQIITRIQELTLQLSQADKEISLLTELADEFTKLSPKSGELLEIENQIGKLGSVEQLNQVLAQSLNLLEDEDISALNLLQQIRKSLDQIKGKDLSLIHI